MAYHRQGLLSSNGDGGDASDQSDGIYHPSLVLSMDHRRGRVAMAAQSGGSLYGLHDLDLDLDLDPESPSWDHPEGFQTEPLWSSADKQMVEGLFSCRSECRPDLEPVRSSFSPDL